MKKLITPFFLLFVSIVANAQTHNWDRTNPGGGGWFGCIGASKSGIVLAGSDLSGAYRSTDGGNTWDVLGDSRGFNETHVSGLGFHRINGDIMFIAGGGIYRTLNGGDSWQNVLGDGGYVTDIELGTDKPWVGYASRHAGNWNTLNVQIYKTTDTGNSWVQIDTNFPDSRIIKLVVDPTNANTVYALTGSGRPVCSAADVFKSTDGGVTWSNMTTGTFGGFDEVADLAIDPQNSSTLYITTVNADCSNQFWIDGLDSKLYKSTNGGSSWTKMQDQGGVLFVHPTTSKVTMVETRAVATWNPRSGTRISNNGGSTFTNISDVGTWETTFHGETQGTYSGVKDGYGRTVGEDLSNPNNLYWMNSQWVLGSKDCGANFSVLHSDEVTPDFWQSTGVDNLVNVDMVISPVNPNLIYLGLADMGIWRSLNKGQTWQSCNTDDSKYGWGSGKGGDFHSIVADPSRENVVWVTCKQGYILKSTNKGERTSWVEVNGGILSNSFVNGLSIDVNSPTSNRTLYVTSNGDVYKSTNDGNSWSKVLTGNGCNFTAVDQSDGNLVYAGGTKGLWRSTNGGQNWSRLNQLSDLPADNTALNIRSKTYKGIYDIDTDPNNADWVYVTVNGFGENRGLFRSKNRGSTWEKLITDKFMRKVAIMPKNSDVIYATSSSAMGSGGLQDGSNGIWFSNDGGANWSKQNQGMAYPFANAIDISNENNPYVLAGSQGTGFQKSDVPLPSSSCGSNPKAWVYQHCNNAGYSVALNEGSYNLSQLIACGVNNDDISSLTLAPGYKITLYQHGSFGGYFHTFTSNDACLSNNTESRANGSSWNDDISSVIIEPIGSGGGNSIVTIRKGNATSFALDGGNGGANNQNVALWTYNQNSVNQQWEEISRGNGFYSYKKVNTNFCIDGSNGGSNGQNVKLWACNDTNQNQQFKKISLSGGNFRLEKRNAPGVSIDGNNGGSNGQNVHMWASNSGNGNQQWIVTQIGNARKTDESTITEISSLALSVYPNPVSENLYVIGLSDGDHTYTLINSVGQSILNGNVNALEGKSAISVEGLSPGIYLLSLESKTIRFMVK
ncbi:MAG: RICIN domain-containing protein [Cyclobacteriaceae bacterium]